MVTITLIDIDGRPAEKEINLNWTFSLLARPLLNEYEADNQSLALNNGTLLRLVDHQSEKLRDLGFEGEKVVKIMHAKKGCPDISVRVENLINSSKFSVMVNPLSKCFDVCQMLETRTGLRLLNNREASVMVKSVYLNFENNYYKTLRDLKIKHNESLNILKFERGGLYCAKRINYYKAPN
ncbi:unnamed protein product [Blepharisma stoltei]|uniref:Uncharacterized protein n=1 Tax=Blepharisma stoltei TaxID=1481888 RepID=A0AAU9JR13_9CILI|nr:unnamed protein product [Blepharisma stoltei]CAG9324181.1 unnamed protein product [Blepharisma stoltei]